MIPIYVNPSPELAGRPHGSLAECGDTRYTEPVGKPPSEAPWLLLVHQLPSEPSRLRVKIWRRLQSVGAVALKNSVWVLPNTPETREDFEWIRGEIVADGGEAMVFAAEAADDISSPEIRSAIESARQSEWLELSARCREALAATVGEGGMAEAQDRLQRRARTLRAQAERLDRIDHFKVPARGEALAALARIDRKLGPDPRDSPDTRALRALDDYQRREWLTRPRPGVDRMASAWLIRRFIDAEARFRFADRVPPGDDVVPFDMFGVALGHHGERVTFETLLHEFGLGDSALSRIAAIVHQLDLRVETASAAETETVARVVEGLRSSIPDDARLLEHGMALFEALYASFSATVQDGSR